LILAVAAESGPALPVALPATTARPWAYFVSVRFAKGTVSVAAPVASTVAYATRGELCNEHGEFMGLHGDLMGLTGDLMGLYGDFIGLTGDLMGLYGDFIGLNGDFMGFHGISTRKMVISWDFSWD
jgi:hypothetical protein